MRRIDRKCEYTPWTFEEVQEKYRKLKGIPNLLLAPHGVKTYKWGYEKDNFIYFITSEKNYTFGGRIFKIKSLDLGSKELNTVDVLTSLKEAKTQLAEILDTYVGQL